MMTPVTHFLGRRDALGGACCGAGYDIPLMDDTGMMSSMFPTVSNRTYCTTVGGVQGCCKLNHICNQLSNECTVAGQVRCPNENYCCGMHAFLLSIDSDGVSDQP